MQRRLILASTSPRRKELLASTGLQFETASSNYEEDMTLPLNPSELAKYLSKGKAEAVAGEYKSAVILAADTFIAFNDKVLGKPHTPEKAKETLQMLSGNTHLIITGFTIIDTDSRKTFSDAIETKVTFKELSSEDIDAYIATGEPLDKAGAYAIQGEGRNLVANIEGDYSNIVGLPVEDVLKALDEFGISAIH